MGLTARARLSRRARARLLDERGFTLPELLVTMAILLIVVGALASVLVSATNTEMDANRRFQAQGQARAALDEMRREVHCASAITQDNSTATAMSPGTSYSAFTVTLAPGCAGNQSGSTQLATWCTTTTGASVSGDYALYRATAATTSPPATCAATTKIKWADYIQPTTLSPSASTPFCLPDTTHACGSGAYAVYEPATSLPLLHVTIPVNLNGPSSTIDGYNLVDDIALRNGTRS
jgi:prepilin-type N-terminal cleavage/methylation domain-containing protein